MQKLIKYTGFLSGILLLVIVSWFTSCTKEPVDDAAMIAIRYLTTTDEKQLFNFLNSASQRRIENMKKIYGSVYPFIWVHHDADAAWDVVKLEKTDNKAIVTLQCIKHKKQNAIGLEVVHTLVKEDGKWKIDISDELPSR
ncbi:MAG: hypothetical protein AB1444_09625 [Spirochaetota bacterium]